MSSRILTGDCRTVLATLTDESVHTVVTSPPYYGLRDYGVTGQLGLEATPAEFIASMVAVFREVRRVLRKDGTLWLNIGDSYAGSQVARDESSPGRVNRTIAPGKPLAPGYKPKDLIGIPWMLAFALRDDGWYLRSDIIWSKPNPMPESVQDRPTKAHEYLFLLTKSARYYYDADSIREDGHREAGVLGNRNGFRGGSYIGEQFDNAAARKKGIVDTNDGVQQSRNKRSVWEIATAPFSEAHFATFPPALVEPCIKAGTSEKGCCPECGAPWVRVVDKHYAPTERRPAPNKGRLSAFGERAANMTGDGFIPNRDPIIITTGWRPSCAHAHEPQPCTVLDPFVGAGTTLLVADRLQRHGIGIEFDTEYAELARRRLTGDAPMFAEVEVA